MELPEEEDILTAIIPEDCKDEFCRKFVFKDEDHTLGNSLRFIISQYREVKFCAYTIPHPADKKMVLQIQTVGITAIDALRRGLQDLGELCDYTIEIFEQAVVEQTEVEQTKVEQTKVEQTKVEQTKVEQTKVEQTEVEQTKVEQTEVEQTKVEQTEVEQTKVEQTEVEQTKVEQTKVEQTEVEQSNVN